MDVSVLTGINSDYANTLTADRTAAGRTNTGDSFDDILTAAMNMIRETDRYQNAAEEAEISFALGESNSTHELLVAQEKANIALSYTVAVRDKVLEAYKEIMNMQV